ncbi:85/88 kDa calcium-independent phospholipase A2-like [Haliotis rufescens]|uniref:85/88 kDa calcium-independent phospholipase A2-like n=1 Tax=Haliotis rufescens TaxID=6454 RepID=UPI00201EF131|nr:85/88 kDa calcium-independent phospholipase A2-like [Haliotis rufescens]XP_048248075.1 85/88 kDa calcium-independent phospholipase A2-like [Haliotis rufescens]
MAGLLKNFVGGIINAASANINPYKVQASNADTYRGFQVINREEWLFLYKRPGCYECVLMMTVTSKCFSIFRIMMEAEALSQFNILAPKMVCLVTSSSSLNQEDVLQKVSDCIREHPTWTACHIAAYIGLYECFRHEIIRSAINTVCPATGLSPLMASVQGKQIQCIQELLMLGARIDVSDKYGLTVYHHAVLNNPSCLSMVASYDKEGVMNWLDGRGETPLLMACKKKLPEATEMLLHVCADPKISATSCLPVHAAVDAGDVRSLELICRNHPDQLGARDHKYGGTPLHWAKTKEVIEFLALAGCDMNSLSNTRDTALHVMISTQRLDCLMTMLCYGADCNMADKNAETPLHWAVQRDDVEFVRTFVVFGASVNLRNKNRHTSRHLAAVSKGKNKDLILYFLHVSGAKRCGVDVKGCLVGCVPEGTHNGIPDPVMRGLLRVDSVALFDEMLSAHVPTDATIVHKAGSVLDMVDAPSHIGDRVLCLDGGGIRGLVLIQMLMEIEAASGRPIKDCFDWIGGTSTGGILALGIARGFSLQYLKGVYFRLKDEVFKGRRPYSSEPFEAMLKREFGEEAVMTDIKHPKVLVTAVLADRNPAELHMFRTYRKHLKTPHRDDRDVKLVEVPDPEKQPIWLAARCSGAAPTYFRAYGKFLDGGLIANNPTLDVLTEIHEYNLGLKQNNEGHQVRPLGCVVSLGTGRVPQNVVQNVDVFRPEGLFDAAKAVMGVSSLGNLVIDQATVSEGRPVDRARAWCSMINVPFYRYSPQLSENVALDCHDNSKLINMMWESHCYMVANRHRIEELATMLNV